MSDFGLNEERTEEVDKFISKYSTQNFVDVSVKELRHIIPLVFMEAYIEKYGLFAKKVRNMWLIDNKPDDWPHDVPFVDPNNSLKTQGSGNCKPKKDICLQMLRFLVKHLKERKSYSAKGNKYNGKNSSPPDVVSSSFVYEMLSPKSEQVSRMEEDDYGDYMCGSSVLNTQDMILQADYNQDEFLTMLNENMLSALIRNDNEVLDSTPSEKPTDNVIEEYTGRIEGKLMNIKQKMELNEDSRDAVLSAFEKMKELIEEYASSKLLRGDLKCEMIMKLSELQGVVDAILISNGFPQFCNAQLANVMVWIETKLAECIKSHTKHSTVDGSNDIFGLNIKQKRQPEPATILESNELGLNIREYKASRNYQPSCIIGNEDMLRTGLSVTHENGTQERAINQIEPMSEGDQADQVVASTTAVAQVDPEPPNFIENFEPDKAEYDPVVSECSQVASIEAEYGCMDSISEASDDRTVDLKHAARYTSNAGYYTAILNNDTLDSSILSPKSEWVRKRMENISFQPKEVYSQMDKSTSEVGSLSLEPPMRNQLLASTGRPYTSHDVGVVDNVESIGASFRQRFYFNGEHENRVQEDNLVDLSMKARPPILRSESQTINFLPLRGDQFVGTRDLSQTHKPPVIFSFSGSLEPAAVMTKPMNSNPSVREAVDVNARVPIVVSSQPPLTVGSSELLRIEQGKVESRPQQTIEKRKIENLYYNDMGIKNDRAEFSNFICTVIPSCVVDMSLDDVMFNVPEKKKPRSQADQQLK